MLAGRQKRLVAKGNVARIPAIGFCLFSLNMGHPRFALFFLLHVHSIVCALLHAHNTAQ
jgi:hypothetical protein